MYQFNECEKTIRYKGAYIKKTITYDWGNRDWGNEETRRTAQRRRAYSSSSNGAPGESTRNVELGKILTLLYYSHYITYMYLWSSSLYKLNC